MTTPEKVEHAIKMIDEQAQALVEIVSRAKSDHNFDAARERMKRWKERASILLAQAVHPNEGEKLRKKRKGSFIMGEPFLNLRDEAEMYLGFLQSLREEVEKYPDDILSVPVPADQGPLEQKQRETRAASNVVFIIHGHDELNLLRLKELLRDRWNLEPVVLSAKAGKGRTLIEKFEQEAQRASYALALFTPDDFIEVPGGNGYGQARPNVIFELGWFHGRLGRDRVCILFKKGTKIHSDLDGISRVEFVNSIEERVVEIEKELLEAGILKR